MSCSCGDARSNAGQCWNGVLIVPPSGYPTSGQWVQGWDFDTNPPTLIWINAAGLLSPQSAPSVMRKKKRPTKPKKPKKPRS